MDVRMFTVGAFAENSYFVRLPGSAATLVVDPGDEADRLLAALDELEAEVAAILLTHTHIDHVRAVAPIARATDAEVWCPKLELPVLASPDSFNPWVSEIGTTEGWDAEHALEGGETLELAGMSIEVVFVPGHSPGHVAYAIEHEGATHLFAGDVLFQRSVGRTDLPGGDWPTLLASIGTLVERFPEATRVYPGHMGVTTLGAERATNPFLDELRASR